MFDFTFVHLCQKPNTKMDKLGHFGLGLVRSLFFENDLAYCMLGFRCMCKELNAVNTYIEVQFDVVYFQ